MMSWPITFLLKALLFRFPHHSVVLLSLCPFPPGLLHCPPLECWWTSRLSQHAPLAGQQWGGQPIAPLCVDICLSVHTSYLFKLKLVSYYVHWLCSWFQILAPPSLSTRGRRLESNLTLAISHAFQFNPLNSSEIVLLHSISVHCSPLAWVIMIIC